MLRNLLALQRLTGNALSQQLEMLSARKPRLNLLIQCQSSQYNRCSRLPIATLCDIVLSKRTGQQWQHSQQQQLLHQSQRQISAGHKLSSHTDQSSSHLPTFNSSFKTTHPLLLQTAFSGSTALDRHLRSANFDNNCLFTAASSTRSTNPYQLTQRQLSITAARLAEDSSKVESSVKALRSESKSNNSKTLDQPGHASEGAVQTVVTGKSNDIQSKKDQSIEKVEPKRSLAKIVWDELVHYYHGFRLLFIDIKVSSRYVWKVLRGNELSRREHRQLVRTVADLFRLVPFSVFIIVPFMELLLPFFIRFFPNLLPSTFQTAKDKESKLKNQLKVKLDMAKFLQNTLDEMALQAKGESHSHKAKEFAEFFDKIRKTGEAASNEDILRFSKLFEDEITLDSLSRPQLTALCRLLELQPLGTNAFLRFQLRMKLRSLNTDDQVIQQEGIGNLTIAELQQACRQRGMRSLGVPEDRLRFQLQQWLELSLNEKIPPSLLLLSRALYLPENIPTTDQLKATLQTLPEELGTEARYRLGEKEGKVDNRTKIELIKQEEEAIKKESEEQIKEDRETKVANQEVLVDKAVEILDETQSRTKEKEIELTKEDLDTIEDALNTMSIEKKQLLIEKEELEDLKEEMKDYNEDIAELQQIVKDRSAEKDKVTGLPAESKAAKRLAKRVGKMISNLDNVFDKLESKKKTLEEKIDVLSKEGKETVTEEDNLVNVAELLVKIEHLKKVGDEAKLTKIFDVLDMMDVDHDGRVDLDVLVKVLELIGRDNVKINSTQMKEIINLVMQEDEQRREEQQKKKELEEQAASKT